MTDTRARCLIFRFTFFLFLMTFGIFAFCGCLPSDATSPLSTQVEKPSPAVIKALSDFNRGAALLEQYKYAQAAQAFEQVLTAVPAWQAAQFNLGLAYLNLQDQANATAHLDQAKQTFETLLQRDPNHLHARFCLGLYFQHVGDNPNALSCFEAVHQAAPLDPHVGYKYAETLLGLDRQEAGIRALEKVVEIDQGFVSALYRLAIQYQRTGQRDKAMPLFTRFKDLKKEELAGGSFTILKTYGTVGKYYLALDADNLPIPRTTGAKHTRLLFSPEITRLDTQCVPWDTPDTTVQLPGLAANDIDGDGDLDLCITALDRDGSTGLWLNQGNGQFTKGARLTDKGISPCFGDVDNDGDLDLWLGRAGKDILFDNDGKGNFQATAAEPNTEDTHVTRATNLLDIDSDGDLDLCAWRQADGPVPIGAPITPAASNLFNNNRDGSYKDIGAQLGLAFTDTTVSAVIYDDLDSDRDLDMLLFTADDPNAICWINDRAWQHHLLGSDQTHLTLTSPVVSATTGDPDNDGDRDILVCTEEGMILFNNTGNLHFERNTAFASRFGRLSASGSQFVDMDNDGDLDIFVPDALRTPGQRGPTVLINDWPLDQFTNVLDRDPGNLMDALTWSERASGMAADFTGNGRCDCLIAPMGESPILLTNVTQGGHWLGVDLKGTRGNDQKSRSNNSAIGARIDIKTGLLSQQHIVGGHAGPVTSLPLRIHAGLGSNTRVDWLRITWPDAVLQAELELPVDQITMMTETPRKVSSCPHLFAWTGHSIEMISDFGGMGGMGYLAEPGAYPTPDPTEYVPVPNLQARDGQYLLHVLEPIEEIVYFDEAKLLAVDHPLGTQVYPNEMMAVNCDPPEFELFCIDKRIEAIQATDHRGQDVTTRLATIDRLYAGATEPHKHFTGYAEPHHVDLDFGDQLSQLTPDGRLVLFVQGWVHYSYSSTNFAAAQAKLRLQAPSIYVKRDNQWIELFHEVAYPAGLRHMMTLEVTGKVEPADRIIRIASNMDVYWDRIFLAPLLDRPELRIHEEPVKQADLQFLGYPKEYSPDGRLPNLYDYESVDRTIPWKSIRGNYTRFGEVTDLLHEPDDCYVIMGPGEELTLRFDEAAFGPIPAGCVRSFILKTDSYCKDMDLYTAHPETVTPLPFHDMTQYPYDTSETYPSDDKHRRYHEQYNTRVMLD